MQDVIRDGKLVHLNWMSIYPVQLDWLIFIQNIFYMNMDIDIF